MYTDQPDDMIMGTQSLFMSVGAKPSQARLTSSEELVQHLLKKDQCWL